MKKTIKSMKRVIIVEGPDGCGKSVLATDLARRRGALLTRHGPYPGDGARVWLRYLEAMLPAYADVADVVLDRSWLSEPIYGAAYRGGTNRISVAARRALERVALGRDAAVVMCRVPKLRCFENFRRRKAEGGEYLDDVKQLNAVYDGYKRLTYAAGYGGAFTDRWWHYDFTDEEKNVDGLAVDLNYGSAKTENLGPGIGAWRPGEVTLLVGERPGGFGGRWHLPFVSDQGCSAWLAEQLEAAKIPERDLYWINARQSRGERDWTWSDFLDDLRPKKVIALGEDAVAWCQDATTSYVAVDHPQYWKRFHHSKPYPLIKEIKR